jgi:hypothetical protein
MKSRKTWMTVAAFLAASYVSAHALPSNTGSSFDCANSRDRFIAQVCQNPRIREADLRQLVSYYVVRHLQPQNNDTHRAHFISTIRALRAECGNSAFVDEQRERCVIRYMDGLKAHWDAIIRQSGNEAALFESGIDLNSILAFQARLAQAGFLPENSVVDGLFGNQTRAAITRMQQQIGIRAHGFVDEQTLRLLVNADNQRQASLRQADVQQRPASAPLTPAYADYLARMTAERERLEREERERQEYGAPLDPAYADYLARMTAERERLEREERERLRREEQERLLRERQAQQEREERERLLREERARAERAEREEQQRAARAFREREERARQERERQRQESLRRENELRQQAENNLQRVREINALYEQYQARQKTVLEQVFNYQTTGKMDGIRRQSNDGTIVTMFWVSGHQNRHQCEMTLMYYQMIGEHVYALGRHEGHGVYIVNRLVAESRHEAEMARRILKQAFGQEPIQDISDFSDSWAFKEMASELNVPERLAINRRPYPENLVVDIRQFNSTAFRFGRRNPSVRWNAAHMLHAAHIDVARMLDDFVEVFFGDDSNRFSFLVPEENKPEMDRLRNAWGIAFSQCPGRTTRF